MKVCVISSYYPPHLSGISQTVADFAEGLAGRGHDVSVVSVHTNKHTKSCKSFVRGVKVYRARSLGYIGRAPVSPAFVKAMLREANRADVVHVHLPLPEAAIVASFVHRPIVVTYHCDVDFGATIPMLDFIAIRLGDCFHKLLLRRSSFVTASTVDYARSSRLGGHILSRFRELMSPIRRSSEIALSRRPPPQKSDDASIFVGFLGRASNEKGLGVLADAIGNVGDARVKVIVGGNPSPIGQTTGAAHDLARLCANVRVECRGELDEDGVEQFFRDIDLLVVPSTSRLESLSLSQVQSILNGVPVLVSDLPGVRHFVDRYPVGRKSPAGDSDALARAIDEFAARPWRVESPWVEQVARDVDLSSAVQCLEELLQEARRLSDRT